jgi:hypothetical protein
MTIIITGPFELTCYHCGRDLDAQIDIEGNPGEATKQAIRVKQCEWCEEDRDLEEIAGEAGKLMSGDSDSFPK